MTDTPTRESVEALAGLLSRPYGNLTSGEKTDAATTLLALQARVEELEAAPERKSGPTRDELNSACLSYDHSFRLMSIDEANMLRFQAREWFGAWAKERPTLMITPSPAPGE